MRYSTLGGQDLETSLILDTAVIDKLIHTPTPRLARCSCSVLPMHGEASQFYIVSSFSHDSVYQISGKTQVQTVLM
jgi:hypothetical protein